MTDLTLICETCKFPIAGDTGSIYVRIGDVGDIQAAERDRRDRRGDGLHSAAIDVMEYMTEPRRVHWRAAHDKCRTDHDESCYEIDGDKIDTWQGLCRWTAHLMEKRWFLLSDWGAVLRELGSTAEPARIRTVERRAA